MSQKKYIKGKIPLLNGNSSRITNIILSNPSKTFHIRGLSKETKTSTTTVLRAIKELQKEHIINVIKTPITTEVKANLDSASCIFLKRMLNLKKLMEHNIVEFIVDSMHPEAIVLFGSYSKGEDVEESDIDLLIITHSKEDEAFGEFISEAERSLHRKINPIIIPTLAKSSPEFKNNVSNGIILYGYLKVV